MAPHVRRPVPDDVVLGELPELAQDERVDRRVASLVRVDEAWSELAVDPRYRVSLEKAPGAVKLIAHPLGDVARRAVLAAVFAAPAALRWLPALAGAAGVAVALTRPARNAWAKVSQLRSRVGTWVDAQQARLDLAASVAAQEVADLQGQLQNLTAGGQLAGLVAEQAGSGTYRSRLGLMTQIRTDFERMAQLLAQAGQESVFDLSHSCSTG
jgi:hypothetical protein